MDSHGWYGLYTEIKIKSIRIWIVIPYKNHIALVQWHHHWSSLGGKSNFQINASKQNMLSNVKQKKHQQQNSAPKLNPSTSYSPTKNIYKQHQNQPTCFFLCFSFPFILTWISKTQQKTVADLDPDTTEKLMTHKAPVSSVTFFCPGWGLAQLPRRGKLLAMVLERGR